MLTIHIPIGFGNPYVRVEVGRKAAVKVEGRLTFFIPLPP
jgi:hypothetical protein